MKGIVVDYFDEKGFGFIEDENREKRFFHISKVRQKSKFLSNITAYYFSNYVERDCFVIDFTPDENSKGLNAQNINLTKQIFNDKSVKTDFEAIVVDIKYDVTSLTRIVQGVKKGKSEPFGATAGGNGTFRIGYPEFLKELNIFFRRTDDIGWGEIDVRELALGVNSRSKITDKFVNTLHNQLVGQSVRIFPRNNKWALLNDSILEI